MVAAVLNLDKSPGVLRRQDSTELSIALLSEEFTLVVLTLVLRHLAGLYELLELLDKDMLVSCTADDIGIDLPFAHLGAAAHGADDRVRTKPCHTAELLAALAVCFARYGTGVDYTYVSLFRALTDLKAVFLEHFPHRIGLVLVDPAP